MLVSVLLLAFTATGADLTCSHSADFGANARVEWRFNDMKGSQIYVVYDGKPTVPVNVPVCRIPTSVTTKAKALLTCSDKVGSPPPTYKWYKGSTLLPENPKQFPAFQNATYRINGNNGNLEFSTTSKLDTGSYYCEASNDAGLPQKCKAVTMEVRDVNTGGIVAGVIVALLLVALLVFGLWYANKKGYLP
ncbi:hypothetical protein CRUP_021437, partial [Coryphaenoides rupestris]